MQFFDAYPYMGLSLALLFAFLVGFALCPDLRRLMLLSGALTAPFAFSELVCVPRYWNPCRVATILRTGPEDVITAFATGGLAWLLGFWLVRRRLTVAIVPARAISRYLTVTVLAAALTSAYLLAGWGVNTAGVVATLCADLVLLCMQPKLWRCSLTGGIGFTIIYTAAVFCTFRLWPHFAQQWTRANLWGVFVLDIPLDEIVWAFTTSAGLPLFLGYVLGAVVADPPAGRLARGPATRGPAA